MKLLIKGTLFIALCACCSAAAFAEQKSMRDMMAQCDINKDGMISEDEFMKSKKEHFLKMDKDSDGRLDGSEQTAMIDEMHYSMKGETNIPAEKMKTGKM